MSTGPSLQSLQDLLLTMTDRCPAIPKALRMSRATADHLCVLLDAKAADPAAGSISGMRIYYKEDLPYGEWEELISGVWQKPEGPI